MAGRGLSVLLAAFLAVASPAAAGPAIHFQRAEEAYEKGDYEAALREYDAILEISGESGPVRHNRALVFLALGEEEEARAEAEGAVKLDPGEGSYLVTLGVTYLLAEEPDLKQAKKVLKKAVYILQRDKDWTSLATAYYNLGVIAVRENDTKEAKRLFSRAVELNPGDERFTTALESVRHEDTGWF